MKILNHILVCLFRALYVFIIILLLFLLAVPHVHLMAKKIEHLLNARLPADTRVSELSFSKIELSIRSASIRQIRFVLKKSENEYRVFADAIFLLDVRCLLSRKECRLLVEQLSVENADLKIAGAHGDFMVPLRSEERLAKGFVAVDSTRYKDYEITKMSSDLGITDTVIVFERAAAQAYQGRVKAEGSYQFLPEEKIEIALDFKGIDTHAIHGVNSQWKGVLEGKARYTGTMKKIGSLTAEFRSPSSEMERTLLKYLMGDVGNALAFLPFAKILESAEFIHLDNFQGTVHNLEQDSVSVKLSLESRQLNLNLNPDITINLR